MALEQLKLFEKKLVEINNCKLKSNFDIRYLRSLYDLRCNVENVEESEEKITLLNKIKLEIKNLDMYKNSLGRSKCLKLFLLDNFKCGYSLLVIWEKLFKNIEKKLGIKSRLNNRGNRYMNIMLTDFGMLLILQVVQKRCFAVWQTSLLIVGTR